ncbi:long-chain fatty acid--CoA ligase [Pseudonocardiaceae bacterium YIM PH 21723]|nr:long-chain fatty acid--CoA ligase [Pseudonocardiaceae bacterium YIM PH 21723]
MTTLCATFQATVAAHPDVVALRAVGDERGITYREYGERVQRIATGLHALGVRAGDTVGLMLRNRPEFSLVDMAILHLGAVSFSVYNTSSAEQLAYLFGNAGNRVVITEEEFADTVRTVASVDQFILIENLDELENTPSDLNFEASWKAVQPEDLLTIIYTSGTTGPPKGVELTHANIVANSAAERDILVLPAGSRVLSYLPSAHAFDRIGMGYVAIDQALELISLADAKQLGPALVATQPHLVAGVPRVWEKLHTALLAGIAAHPNREVIEAAIESGDDEVLGRLRAVVGLDQTRYAVVGAAPSAPHMLEFFAKIGLPLLEGWGMTESSCVSTFNRPGSHRFGTVGTAVRGIEIRLDTDGEVLLRGPQVMRGYRSDPERTAEVLTADGWLRTGDIGSLADGYLSIVDRKKDLIINAAGKNMSPANIEATVKGASPLIDQVVCIGDRRPYNVALIVLDPVATQGKPDLDTEIAAAIDQANARLSRVEQIKRFTVLHHEWLPDSDELTPTSKLKRKPIAAKYADLIDQLYA